MSLHPTDYGHSETDKELEALLRRLEISYREARISLFEKIEKYMDQFAQEDAFKRALYDSGELSHEDYMAWRARKFAGTKQWRDMLDQLSDDMTHRNEIAASMINDTLPDVYALNHNFGTFEAEKGSGYDTTYTLYDKHTVARLLKGNPDLLPAPHVDIAKDKRWNQQQIQSALLQGLLQGESMSDIANRFNELTPSKTVEDIRNAYRMTAEQIAKAIARKNAVAAMRNARTSVTGAENAGRIDSYKRAQGMGIKMRQQWMATLDGRTRDSHVALDGETQEVGKKFSNGCRYPGDPSGPGSEVYNCRCSVVAIVAGADPYDPHLRESAYLKEEGLTYEDWKEQHGGHVERQQDNFDRSKISYSPVGEVLRDRLESVHIDYRQVQHLEKQLSQNEIISRLSGGDQTAGSCFSLACAYAGNVNGLDVIDYRGGKSQDEFAGLFRGIARLRGVSAEIEPKGGLKPAKALLKKVEEGKEYIFNTGRHSAVVRNIGGKLQYLELQSATDSGWHDFEYDKIVFAGKPYESTVHYGLSETLEWRFGCKGRTISESSLIDIESLKDSDEFRDLLGYINTAEDEQKKGTSGSIK